MYDISMYIECQLSATNQAVENANANYNLFCVFMSIFNRGEGIDESGI